MQAQIETQGKGLARAGLLDQTEIANRLSVEILDKPLFAGHPPQPLFECQLNAGNSMAIHVSQTQNLRGDLPCRVVPTILPLSPHTRETFTKHSSREIRGLMSRKVHELLVAIEIQFVLQSRCIERQQRCQVIQARAVLKLLRVSPQGDNGRADRKRGAITILNESPIYRYFRRAHGAQRPLFSQKDCTLTAVSDLQENQTTH